MKYRRFKANRIDRWYVPSKFPETNWQEFVREERTEHLIVSIRNEIIEIAANEIGQHHRKRRSFQFTSQCLQTLWLHLFDASIDIST